MKFLIASDLHGSAKYTEELIRAFEREGADRMVLLGDILYHGPRNDLPELYSPKRVIELLNEKRDKIVSIRGNCDSEVDQMVLSFPIMAEYILLPLGNKVALLTHGHIYSRENIPSFFNVDLLITGHTHIPAMEKLASGMLYLNPGSVSIPKAGSEHSYMTLTTECDRFSFSLKNLDGVIYSSLEI